MLCLVLSLQVRQITAHDFSHSREREQPEGVEHAHLNIRRVSGMLRISRCNIAVTCQMEAWLTRLDSCSADSLRPE